MRERKEEDEDDEEQEGRKKRKEIKINGASESNYHRKLDKNGFAFSHKENARQRFSDYTFNLYVHSLTQTNRRHSFSHHIVYPTTYFQSIANPLSSNINMLISDKIQQGACCQLGEAQALCWGRIYSIHIRNQTNNPKKTKIVLLHSQGVFNGVRRNLLGLAS